MFIVRRRGNNKWVAPRENRTIPASGLIDRSKWLEHNTAIHRAKVSSSRVPVALLCPVLFNLPFFSLLFFFSFFFLSFFLSLFINTFIGLGRWTLKAEGKEFYGGGRRTTTADKASGDRWWREHPSNDKTVGTFWEKEGKYKLCVVIVVLSRRGVDGDIIDDGTSDRQKHITLKYNKTSKWQERHHWTAAK